MTNEELIAEIAKLKQQAADFTAKMQDAATRKAVIADQLDKLTEKLSEVAGTVDWAQVGARIEQAANDALQAVQELEETLNDAGVEYE